ncbi:MAG: phage holin family protein [Pyrinomonadaceae bacterium]
MAQQQMAKEERSLGDLFADLAGETGTLVRQEVALAQTEIVHKATKAGKNVGYLAVGGAVAYAGALALIAGLVILLANFMPGWVSALLVGAVIAGAGYFMISSALTELRKTDPMPRDTIETLKEDAKWLKNEVT